MFSIAGSIIVVVVVLTLFFNFLSWVGKKAGSLSTTVFGSKDLLNPETPLTIHLIDGTILEDSRYLGNLPDEDSKTSDIPTELRAMVLIQLSDGRRSLIRPRSIKSIDFPSDQPAAPVEGRAET